MIQATTTEIYLDANATTPVLPAAATAAHEAMHELFGNPSSSHTSGLRAKNILETARDLARKILGAEKGKIVFTSGATEAIQLGIFSTLCQIRNQQLTTNDYPAKVKTPDQNSAAPLLLYGATEHKAVPQALQHWNDLLGIKGQLLPIPVDRRGQLDLDFLTEHAPAAGLICTMAVNNETGVITDLSAVESAIRTVNPNVPWLVDCVQAIGKLKLNLAATTIDYAALSGHKIYAPKGIGLLYVREGAALVPLLAGGGQEQGARGGTENLPGVAAIAAVLEKLVDSPTRTFADNKQLELNRERIVTELKRAFPTIVFNAPFENSVPTTINFAVKGFPSKELLDLFDAAGMRVSSGSACGSAIQGSYVLEAMGLPRWQSDGAIRLSFGPLDKKFDIDAAVQRIAAAGRAMCESCLVVSPDTELQGGQPLDGLVQLKNGSMCTWLLMDAKSKRCIIIDPFAELADRIQSLIRCQQSRVMAILDTHAHVDHDSCRAALLESLGDWALPSARTNDLLGWPERSDGDVQLADGRPASYLRISNDLVLAQTELPGHTKIGRAFFVGQLSNGGAAPQLLPADVTFAFTGDMILMGGIGRTDFESSDPSAMYDSLRRLPKLIDDQTVICPTHDYNNDFATTLAAEFSSNDFLRSIVDPTAPISPAEFLAAKPIIDRGIADETNTELVCGLIRSVAAAAEPENSIDLHKSELMTFFQQHCNSRIIDVREPQEFAFAQDWSELGLDAPPENVPLTRLAGYLPKLLASASKSVSLQSRSSRPVTDDPQETIFLCRSGKRSGKAAEIVRRLGVPGVRHIAGGIALNISHQCGAADPIAESGYVI